MTRRPVEAEKRDCEVRLMLTLTDRLHLERIAMERAVSMSDLMRQLLRAEVKAEVKREAVSRA